ncbi:hypothetical protein [Paracraurococcus lichenis]|uniref:Uncharacterized protein n=1 Tax=Paracraurococcus lichenis TaxID=3064888 RepID=A0ABT9EA44_9PROT|nr:hypothetical protein [Paracraurococcus sp. LOR1-02]MDO9713043.1 hypothetical protein [Paracraurococcus sp. LOR1-02]
MAKWTEAKIGALTQHAATVGDYDLSVTGDGSHWMWAIWRQGRDRAEFRGLEQSAADAMRTAESVVQRVLDWSPEM